MVNKQEFEAWLTHPTTKEVRQYLRDYQGRLKDAWGDGQQMDPHHQYLAQALGDLAELSHEDIEGFYDESDESA